LGKAEEQDSPKKTGAKTSTGASTISPSAAVIDPSEVQNVSQNVTPGTETDEAVNQEISVSAEKLTIEQNPRIYGSVSQDLKLETVSLDKKEDGSKKLKISGKALPNTILKIYIFSDPIIITVKTDGEGNWNYELKKEISDGKHEAYVAITDNSGNIVDKSEPIAFIKTAEAANIIPISELDENQPPIERFQRQYIIIGIIIIFTFLGIALGIIGIITHKRQLDERIN
jgi:hypothetical protein